MGATFDYLIDKIDAAEFSEEPFHHVEMDGFLSDEHFREIIAAPEIRLDQAATSEELCDQLLERGYKPIKFPGCTTSIPHYLNWKAGKSQYANVDTCEGFGIAFRLERAETPAINELKEFLASEPFVSALCRKFGLERADVFEDVGIQKYLDGYEISPHPDIRKKALTFMVNINPSDQSEGMDHHTKYLVFRDSKQYVSEFWRHNPQYDRSWVPWEWCDTVKEQRRNNSIVIFHPAHDTMHAVKADYDHLVTQRTQLYGNLWYGQRESSDVRDASIVNLPQIPWQGLVIDESRGTHQHYIGAPKLGLVGRVKRAAKTLIGS